MRPPPTSSFIQDASSSTDDRYSLHGRVQQPYKDLSVEVDPVLSIGLIRLVLTMKLIVDTYLYYRVLFYFLLGGTYEECPFFKERKHAKIQVYSLAMIMWLWNKPHYRNGTFQQDMVKNLRNVAIPGTGIPLSVFCYFKITVYWYLLCVNPFICFMAALNPKNRRDRRSIAVVYGEQLLEPKDWFSYWRMNCRLASLHAYVTGSKDFAMEDKWTFLVEGDKKGVPISPFLKAPAAIVVKDKNEEGGMGIYFFKNASQGGDWIIQERLGNDAFIQGLLPDDAPLSTFRVITASTATIRNAQEGEKPRGGGGGGRKREKSFGEKLVRTLSGKGDLGSLFQKDREGGAAGAGKGPEEEGGAGGGGGGGGDRAAAALSTVFRAGRAGADTDHSSILFDVDAATGTVLRGTTNAHWYRLGFRALFTCPWVSTHDQETHPDNGKQVSGTVLPKELRGMQDLVVDAHLKLLPDVPLVGWDVACTDKGMVLLEVNLSCNFFRGSFDNGAYVRFVDEYFAFLEAAERARKEEEKVAAAVQEGGKKDQ